MSELPTECGLITHRKGCVCGGWSKRSVDYAPGFSPPADAAEER